MFRVLRNGLQSGGQGEWGIPGRVQGHGASRWESQDSNTGLFPSDLDHETEETAKARQSEAVSGWSLKYNEGNDRR